MALPTFWASCTHKGMCSRQERHEKCRHIGGAPYIYICIDMHISEFRDILLAVAQEILEIRTGVKAEPFAGRRRPAMQRPNTTPQSTMSGHPLPGAAHSETAPGKETQPGFSVGKFAALPSAQPKFAISLPKQSHATSDRNHAKHARQSKDHTK